MMSDAEFQEIKEQVTDAKAAIMKEMAVLSKCKEMIISAGPIQELSSDKYMLFTELEVILRFDIEHPVSLLSVL